MLTARVMRRLVSLLLAAGLLVPAAWARDYDFGTLHIGQPWARPTTSQAQAGGAFLVLDNRGRAADRLISASSPVAEKVELHTHVMDGTVMRMRPVEGGIALPPGQKVELKPGGMHVMLMGLKQQLKEGETFPLTLRFEAAGEIAIDVRVEKLSGPSGAKHH
jgi:copper(I)-binding protein